MTATRTVAVHLRSAQSVPLSAAQNDENLTRLAAGVNSSALGINDAAGNPIACAVAVDTTNEGAVGSPASYLAYAAEGVVHEHKTATALGVPGAATDCMVETRVNLVSGVVVQTAWAANNAATEIPMQFVRVGDGNGWGAWQFLLASTDASQSTSHTVGDVKFSMNNTTPAGWCRANDGTIGSAASGATSVAAAGALALYTLLYNQFGQGLCPVTGGRGANAAADFAANKPMSLVPLCGRVLGAAGSGAALTARAVGALVGEEGHVLIAGELPSASGGGTVHGGGRHGASNVSNDDGAALLGANFGGSDASAAFGLTVALTGGNDQAHNNIQPTTFLNLYIKL